jgi:hypothetical protein
VAKPKICLAITSRGKAKVVGNYETDFGLFRFIGVIPTTRKRFNFSDRRPGVMENALNALNANNRIYRVIETYLNGRRTVWNDPFKPRRNGLERAI